MFCQAEASLNELVLMVNQPEALKVSSSWFRILTDIPTIGLWPSEDAVPPS